MEACTGGGVGVSYGRWKCSIEDPLFDLLLRQFLCTRMVAPFGAVFVAVVSCEVKCYILIGSIMVSGCNLIDRFIGC